MRFWVLIFLAAFATGCATSRSQQPPPEQPRYDGAAPEYREEQPPFSDPTTAEADAPFPWEITDGSEPVTEVTRPETQERTSPPAVGAEDLGLLPEASHPGHAASLNLAQQGRLSYMNRDYVAARQKLQSALQIWGGNPWAKYYLGLVEFEEGNYSPAVTFAKAALRQLKRYPFWNARAYFLLGEAYERLGRTAESTRAKDEAYELDPNVSLQ